MKIDILNGTEWVYCHRCNDKFGTYYAVDMGIFENPLCFQCILDEYILNNPYDRQLDEPDQ
jgi:hypothetical protein